MLIAFLVFCLPSTQVCRRKPKERMVFLFSDILIYARPNLLEKMESAR